VLFVAAGKQQSEGAAADAPFTCEPDEPLK